MLEALILLLIVLGFVVATSLILPWLNRSQIQELKREIARLKQVELEVSETSKSAESMQAEATNTDWEPPKKPAAKPTKTPPPKPPKAKSKSNFEWQFGAKLPVWLGGIALALAGIFLVKYSIENQLLSPTVRVTLGALFGLALLFSAHWLQSKAAFANALRIIQSLSGAGIISLYASLFAASNLYQLIPGLLAFIGMALVTATAVLLSLRHGAPIALLGLFGGFLTPALVGAAEPSAPLLFTYLYFVVAALLFVIKRQNWWLLSLLTSAGALLWVLVWTLFYFSAGDSIWLGLFLFAISATTIIASKKHYVAEMQTNVLFKPTMILNYFGLIGALILMGLISAKAEFSFLEWGLFGLLALGAIALAFFNAQLYAFMPWAAMLVNAVMLFMWQTSNNVHFILTSLIFAGIYLAGSYFLMWRSRLPVIFAGLLGATSLIYYLLLYHKLFSTNLFTNIPFFWGGLATLLAALAVYVLWQVQKYLQDDKAQQYLFAIFAITASTFVSLALTIELPYDFLPVAFALELFAIAWIDTKVNIKALRPIVGLLAAIFVLLISPQVITAWDPITKTAELVPIVQWPLIQLGIPAIMFFAASFFLAKHEEGGLISMLEGIGIALTVMMAYYLVRHVFHFGENILLTTIDFTERSVITNILFLCGVACFFVGERWQRHIFAMSAFLIVSFALLRILYFDFVFYNPLFSSQQIKGWPVLNTLLLPYGLPIVWTWLSAKALQQAQREQWAHYLYGFTLVLLFSLITLNVRQFFHGEFLNIGATTNVEIYTYSIVWLLLGLGLLIAGMHRHNKMLRYASLAVIIVTVAKVFLYDAAALEGLYRVLSFLGLGLSLLGISYFYTKKKK